MISPYDVLVVGGGPAGASLALHLVRCDGIDPSRIVVIDSARFPRDKPCAGAISSWGLRALTAVGVSLRSLGVRSVPMRGLRVLHGGAFGATESELGALVRRSSFDAALLREAANAGVEVRESSGLVSLAREGDVFRARTATGDVSARYVVACDGAGSRTRKLLGLREPARKGHLYVTDTPSTAEDHGTRAHLCDFDLDVTGAGIEGYYWDFPTPEPSGGDEVWVSRGIYHANITPRNDVKAALSRSLTVRGVDPSKVVLRPFPTRPFVPETVLVHEGVMFVGEAAGIDRTTGEGIAQSIVMAEIAARTLARALRGGRHAIDAYPEAVRSSRVGRHLLQSAWLAARVYGASGARYRTLLRDSPSARRAGAAWYAGERLPRLTKAALAVSLGVEGLRAALL
jgi:flavin-dependent dehydrogenase